MVGRVMQVSLGLVTALWGISAALDLPPPSDIVAGALIALGMAHVIFAILRP